MKTYPIVEIEWTDIVETQVGEWIEPKDIKNQPMPSKSVGYLVKEDKTAVTLMSLQNKNHVALGICIPRRSIDNMRYL